MIEGKLSKKHLERVIHSFLKQHGFKKKATTWIREKFEVYQVFNLQKCPFGSNKFYLNLGIFIKSVEPKTIPTVEYKCHIRIRMGRLIKYFLDYDLIKELNMYYDLHRDELNMDYEVDEQKRAEMLHQLFEKVALPFFDLLDTNEKIKKVKGLEFYRHLLIIKPVYDHFGIPISPHSDESTNGNKSV